MGETPSSSSTMRTWELPSCISPSLAPLRNACISFTARAQMARAYAMARGSLSALAACKALMMLLPGHRAAVGGKVRAEGPPSLLP